MKPLSKYLSATSLVAIALFGCIQQFDSQSFFNEKKEIASQPEAKLTETVHFAANSGNPYKIAPSTTTHILARPISKKTAVIAKLAKKPAAIISNDVIQDDTTGLIDVVTELPEIVTMQTKSAEDNEIINVADAEQAEMASAIRTTGGSAYEATTEKLTSPVDISAFAAIKQADNGAEAYSYNALTESAEALREYATRSGSNTDYAIIVNLGLKSGKKRFFVMDLSTNTIVKSGVVAEGSGDVSSSFEKKYSNEIGSLSTSLGVFKIGKRANKLAYRLEGLEESNNNAYKRAILLQAAEDVPNDEINFPTLKTNGSLSLSTSFFKEISSIVDDSAKPMLLWVNDTTAQNSYTKN